MIKYNSSVLCPLCGKSVNKILTTELRRGSGNVYFCEDCQHGFHIPKNDFDAKKYYAENYRQEYSHNAEEAATNAREIFDVYRHYQSDRINIISPYLTGASELLEVGASSGQFLINIKDRLARVNAIELDKTCCDFMRIELGIFADSELLRESVFANEIYDVVCSFQVMEHVANPLEFINDLSQSTKDRGVIFIEVPNLHDSLLSIWNIDAYKKFFYHSAHLHYFTEDSLRKLAMRAGFLTEQIEIKFIQDYNVLNHLSWIMNGAPQSTCKIGLDKIDFFSSNQDISKWMTERIGELNKDYITKLINVKATSNMMLVLKNER